MRELWDINVEKAFFNDALKLVRPEQLFYKTDTGQHLAYWPKTYKGVKNTLQSRNSFIGSYTEKWATELIQEVVQKQGLFAVQGAVCNEIGLSNRSAADVAITKVNNVIQKPSDIVAIFEVKMSIAWNWELDTASADINLACIGDYNTHRGTPSVLRSDSMLKAIGKSILIKVVRPNVPIIILGNTPITPSYYSKVDHLMESGVIQGFWSVNPKPLDKDNDLINIKNTPKKGFHRFDSFDEFANSINLLIASESNFFSSQKTNAELGRLIEIANREETYEKKAEVFLRLIKK